MKVIVALLVLSFSGVSTASLNCVGWEASAADRRACCQRAHHQHCEDQASADGCCAGHEQGRLGLASPTADPAVSGKAPALSPVPMFDSALLGPKEDAGFAAVVAKRLHGPPVLLAPPLRI